MPITPWGVQTFLNHPKSKSTGWVKFTVRPERSRGAIGIEADAILADCTGKIFLEFEPRMLTTSRNEGMYDRQAIIKVKRSIKHRRIKVVKFRKAVVQFCDKMLEAMDDMESRIDSIPPASIYDSQKENR